MRNAAATRERILEAARAEFSVHGIAGARVDRIAQAAGCNKNLIYIYFEDKETLFATVLLKHLMRIHQEQPFTPYDLPTYAAKVFDFAMTNPDLMRLMAWSALEQNAKGPAGRVAILDAKLQSFDIGLPRSLAAIACSKERAHQQGHWIAQLIERELSEGHAFSTAWARTEQDHPPDHAWVFECKLLRNHAAERESHDVKVVEIERSAKVGTVLCHRFDGRRRFTT